MGFGQWVHGFWTVGTWVLDSEYMGFGPSGGAFEVSTSTVGSRLSEL